MPCLVPSTDESHAADKNIAIDLCFTLVAATGSCPDNLRIVHPFRAPTSRIDHHFKLQALMAVINYYEKQSRGHQGIPYLADPKSMWHSDDQPEEAHTFMQKIGHSMLAGKVLEDYAMVWEHLIRYWAHKPLHSSTGVVDIFSELTISKRSKLKACPAPTERPVEIDPVTGKPLDTSFPVSAEPMAQSAHRYMSSMPFFDKPDLGQVQNSVGIPNDSEWAKLTDDADDSESDVQYASKTHQEDGGVDAEAEPLPVNRRDWKLVQKLFAKDESRVGQVRWDELNKVRLTTMVALIFSSSTDPTLQFMKRMGFRWGRS